MKPHNLNEENIVSSSAASQEVISSYFLILQVLKVIDLSSHLQQRSYLFKKPGNP